MESVKVNCPYCSKELEINPEFAGERVPCPFCSGTLTLSPEMLAGETIEVYRNCPVCGERILKSVKKCRHCGEFVTDPNEPLPETILWFGHPSIFCYLLPLAIGVLLLPVGIGFIVLAVLFIKVHSIKYLISDRKIRLESGVFTREAHEIRLKDIKAITLRKGFHDSMRGTGSIIISPAGVSGHQLGLCGISNPEKINSIINDARDRLSG